MINQNNLLTVLYINKCSESLLHSKFEVISYMMEYLDKVTGDIPACNVQASCQVRQAEALIHWTDVCHTITRVHYDTSQEP